MIALALRRFGYAADRSRPDDEIVDLLIAAESLFLTNTDIPTLAGGSPTVESFADELEEILRRSLKAIGRVASGEGFPPNWDELLFRAGG